MSLAEDAARVAGLDANNARLVASSARTRSWEPGELIARRGELLHDWMFLADGIVLGNVALDDGDVFPCFFYTDGVWLGEYAIAPNLPLSADWVAMTPVTVLAVDVQIYHRLLDEVPGFAAARMRRFAFVTKWHYDAMVVHKVRSTPVFKCVNMLSVLCDIFDTVQNAARRPVVQDSLVIPLSQEVLAGLSGLSRSRFSEFLQQLQEHGLVDLSYRQFRVLKVSAWRRWGHSVRHQRVLPARHLTIASFVLDMEQPVVS